MTDARDIEKRLDDLDGSDFAKVREHSEALRSYVASLRKQLEDAREALVNLAWLDLPDKMIKQFSNGHQEDIAKAREALKGKS